LKLNLQTWKVKIKRWFKFQFATFLHYKLTSSALRLTIIDLSVALYHDASIFEKLLNSEAVTLQDLRDLHDALSRLDTQKYLDEIDLVEPIKFYVNVAKNAPKSIKEALENILNTSTSTIMKDSKDYDLAEKADHKQERIYTLDEVIDDLNLSKTIDKKDAYKDQ